MGTPRGGPGRRPEDVRAWLRGNPTLTELCEAYPAEWATVQRDLNEMLARGDPTELKASVAAIARSPVPPAGRKRPARRDDGQELRAQIRRQMTVAGLRQLALSAATGIRAGRVRFNLLNGYVAQKLLFSGGLERKPVSMRWFSLIWPLLWQRRLLMPLVAKKGIYCFYSRELLAGLGELIGGRPCLEIAAGDGTLARLLTADGVAVTATDNYSWEHAVSFPADVERLDAVAALRRYQPTVVLCSWPPAGNTFEREVFSTASVELYVVIGSRHEYAASDWTAYRRQRAFEFALAERLSRLVLPPELDSGVYVFRRLHQR